MTVILILAYFGVEINRFLIIH